MKNLVFILLSFLTVFTSYGQNPQPVILSAKDSLYSLNRASFFIEKKSTTSISLDNIRHQNFQKIPAEPLYTHSPVWFKFYISPQTKARLLGFLPPLTDRAELYVPVQGGYRKYTGGRLSERPVRYDILESAALYLPADKPDYSRPFYLHLTNITAPEALPLNPGKILLSDKKMPLHYHILRTGKTRKYQIYLGIIALAGLLFLLSFIITRDRNFLHYSLYLLALTAIFVHQIPFLHNFLIRIHPFVPGWISRMGIIFTALGYFYFVVQLLETSRYAPRLDKLIRWVLATGLFYGAWKLFQMILWPEFPGSYPLYIVFHGLFMAVSFFIFTGLWFKPVPRIKKVVILGSYLLIAGHLFSMLFRNDFYFLNTVLAEIGLFYAVILMQYKRIHEERVRYKLHLLAEQQKRENLQALDQMKSKFFSHISHEFRTPLTLIYASLNRIEEKIPPGDSHHIHAIRRHGGRLLELVDQLLDLTKLQSRAMRPHIRKANLHRFARLICENFIPWAEEKNIRYEIRIEPEEHEAFFDKDFLQKMFTNLISNAFKYTPEAGAIICSAYTKNGRFVFEIKNTGEKLNQEELSRLFERFYQKNEYAEGAGIGLSLVKELAQAHGGEISVESGPDAWIVFRLILPVEPEIYRDKGLLPEEALPGPAEKSREEKEDKPLLLIIEDHPGMRNYIAALFEEDFRVLQAGNGEEGIRMAMEHVPDIILSDLMMPGADGYEVCRRLKNDFRTSHIPLILLTAKGEPDAKRKGTGCGAVDYIVKPFDESILKDKVRNWMRILEKHRKRYKQETILSVKDLAVNDTDEKFLEILEKILKERLSDPEFGVNDLAGEMHMSRMQLHRKLKALTGLSASEFLRSQRLKAAAQLLRHTDYNVGEIAYVSGFNNPSYFARIFKETYGVTPAEYRKKSK